MRTIRPKIKNYIYNFFKNYTQKNNKRTQYDEKKIE